MFVSTNLLLAAMITAGVFAQSFDSILSGNSNLSSFYTLLQKYSFTLPTLPDGATVLAPNNDAFDNLSVAKYVNALKIGYVDTIYNLFVYHVIQGTHLTTQMPLGVPTFLQSMLTSGGYTNVLGGQNVEYVEESGNVAVFVSALGARSAIVQSDLAFTSSSGGGVVQVIDKILIPPFNLTYTLQAFNLTSFEGATYAAQSIDDFFYTPNVTMFVPANSAFQALGPAISLMNSTKLATVLDYHLIDGAVLYSTYLTDGAKLTTKQGLNVTITHSNNNVYINSAKLITSDILIMNGVLHVIDNVLNFQSSGAQPNTALATQSAVFTGASTVADVPFTSAIPCVVSCPATAATNTASSSASTSGPNLKPSTGSIKNGLSAGAKSGIAVGVILFTVLLVLGALFFLRCKRKVNKATDQKSALEFPTPSNTHELITASNIQELGEKEKSPIASTEVGLGPRRSESEEPVPVWYPLANEGQQPGAQPFEVNAGSRIAALSSAPEYVSSHELNAAEKTRATNTAPSPTLGLHGPTELPGSFKQKKISSESSSVAQDIGQGSGQSSVPAATVQVNKDEEEANLTILRERIERIREDKERLEKTQELRELEEETKAQILVAQRKNMGL
ncbi:uncharacterized protein PAC_16243 [Phialocephala subalpina]|uniref:FAS1 domain-containing protein n=1 Tax=Phialocephala subalpina TaxID=576137 RepID=A0A1L7XMT0_9HELO|nr:uncharacterized protein PAC_16243 [Phialocephala subalpina]